MVQVPTVSAETIECADGSIVDVAESDSGNVAALCAGRGGVKPGATVQSSNPTTPGGGEIQITNTEGTADQCGRGDSKIKTGIDFGCKGDQGTIDSGILDLLFALLRWLSIGVGIVAVISIIIGGIQYTASQDDPQASAKAIDRIRNTVFALLLYVFIWAIANWLVPGGLF